MTPETNSTAPSKITFLKNIFKSGQSKQQLLSEIEKLKVEKILLDEKYASLLETNNQQKKEYRDSLIKINEGNETLFKRIAILEHITDLKLGNTYNENASRIDKIVFVLNQAQRPLTNAEICDVLCKRDKSILYLEDVKKKISFHLNRALKNGRILSKPIAGKNYHLYFLPNR